MANTFKCTKCDRKFAMAAHLGRHMTTIHGKGSGRKKAVKRKSSPEHSVVSAATQVARSAMADSRTDRLLSDMQSLHSELAAQRNSLDSQIDAVSDAMRALSGTVPVAPQRSRTGAPARRASGKVARDGSLKEYIVRVLGQTTKPMSPSEIGTRVKKSGYKTKSKDLTKAVSNALPQVKGIKRVGFGRYQKA